MAAAISQNNNKLLFLILCVCISTACASDNRKDTNIYVENECKKNAGHLVDKEGGKTCVLGNLPTIEWKQVLSDAETRAEFYINFIILKDGFVEVWTGSYSSPHYGSGVIFHYEKENGKWVFKSKRKYFA